MELTKEKIQYLDTLLLKKGIVYWDIRLEMLDHLATCIEGNMKEGSEFEQSLKQAFIDLNWEGDLSSLNRSMCKEVNKKCRKRYGKEVLGFFKSIRNLALLFSFVIFEQYLSNTINLESFTELNYQFFFLPLVIVIYYGFLNMKNKLGKSIYHLQGFFYMTLSFLVLNMFLLLVVAKNMLSLNDRGMIVAATMLISVHFILSYAGIKVYRKAQADVLRMKKVKQML
jgi:hypothetical protein